MKKEKGITLITLIITIIIMLILVAVTITILIDSDLIGATKTAVEKYESESEKEQHIEQSITIGNETLEQYLANLTEDGGDESGTESYDVTIYDVMLDKDVCTVSIPGWEVSSVGFSTNYIGWWANPIEGYSVFTFTNTITGETVVTEDHGDGFYAPLSENIGWSDARGRYEAYVMWTSGPQ